MRMYFSIFEENFHYIAIDLNSFAGLSVIDVETSYPFEGENDL
jgi:hypothetical protein